LPGGVIHNTSGVIEVIRLFNLSGSIGIAFNFRQDCGKQELPVGPIQDAAGIVDCLKGAFGTLEGILQVSSFIGAPSSGFRVTLLAYLLIILKKSAKIK